MLMLIMCNAHFNCITVVNHCIFARVCEIISFNNCFWGVQKKRRKERRKEEISFRGTLWLFLGLLLPDSEQRFYMQKQNLLIQLSYTLSKHHGHLDSLRTHALQGYSTGMASKFTWMAIKVVLGCQNHRKLRNCLLRLILAVFSSYDIPSTVAAASEDT